MVETKSVIGNSKKILVVDDMKINFLVLRKMLLTQGYEAYYEEHTKNVLREVKEKKPMAVLLDFEMPEMSGPELCRQLKSHPGTADVPVIIITAGSKEAMIEEAFDSGADDYILKPVREKELFSRLHKIWISKELQNKLSRQLEEQAMLTRILSHDISNLATIMTSGAHLLYSKICKAGVADEVEYAKYHQKIVTASERLYSLISSVREIQALDDGKISLKLMPTDLAKIVEECVEGFRERIEKKGINVDVLCDQGITVIAEETSLSISIFNNILSNAIKFTRSGGLIKIHVATIDDFVKVEISDTGIGMPADLLSKVFSRIEKVSRLGTEKEKGTGFGMPIIKRYMELYGGSIQIKSKPVEEFPLDSGTQVTLFFVKSEMNQPERLSS